MPNPREVWPLALGLARPAAVCLRKLSEAKSLVFRRSFSPRGSERSLRERANRGSENILRQDTMPASACEIVLLTKSGLPGVTYVSHLLHLRMRVVADPSRGRPCDGPFHPRRLSSQHAKRGTEMPRFALDRLRPPSLSRYLCLPVN